MKNESAELGRIVEQMATDIYDVRVESASVLVKYADGTKTKIPVSLGKRPGVSVLGKSTTLNVSGNKEKIFESAPKKTEPMISIKKLFSRAGIPDNPHNRKALRQLVEEGRLTTTDYQYRKAE